MILALYLQSDGARWTFLDGPRQNHSEQQHWGANLFVSFAFCTFGVWWLISSLKENDEPRQIELTATAIATSDGREKLQLADLTEIEEISTDGELSLKLVAGKAVMYIPRNSLADRDDFQDLLSELKGRVPHCPANFYEVITHDIG